MSHDEVVRSEGVGGWGLVLVVAVVAALFSMVTQPHRGSSSPAPGVLPSVTPSTSPVPSPSATSLVPSASAPALRTDAPAISLDPTRAVLLQTSGYVSATDICQVTTDHHSTLAVRLLLHNDTQVTELVEELTPALPLGGLVDKGTTLQSGSCTKPYSGAAKAAGQALLAGTAVVVALHLTLPKTCPLALPVGLDVTLSIDGNVRSERIALLPDLGQLTFTTCPATG